MRSIPAKTHEKSHRAQYKASPSMLRVIPESADNNALSVLPLDMRCCSTDICQRWTCSAYALMLPNLGAEIRSDRTGKQHVTVSPEQGSGQCSAWCITIYSIHVPLNKIRFTSPSVLGSGEISTNSGTAELPMEKKLDNPRMGLEWFEHSPRATA